MNDTNRMVAAIADDIMSKQSYNPRADKGRRTIEMAYADQDAVAEYLIASGDRQPVAGYKIAANSAALLERFSLREPASGRVFADQRFQAPAVLPAAGFLEFAYEPEIAAVMGRSLDVRSAPFDRAQIIAAIDRFVPALELLDLRHTDMSQILMPDIIAQNISNEGAVVGGPGVAATELDPASVVTTVTINGEMETDVTGAAPQHPVDAVLWLANHLARRGLGLERNHIVLCGTHAPMRRVVGQAEIIVEMSGLGSVSLKLE